MSANVKEVPQIEAVKYSLRQSKDGLIIAFVIQPEDIDPALNNLPIGKRIMFGWYAVGDDEKPIAVNVTPIPAKLEKPKRDRRPSELCAIRCTDRKFWEWIVWQNPMNQPIDEPRAAAWVRGLCMVKSRSELDTNGAARTIWENIEKDFKAWLLDEQYSPEARGAR